MMQITERVQLHNNYPANRNGKYVLYWMQMNKRIHLNHALSFAIEKANEFKIPLLVYEGLTYDYPSANDRIHAFILEGINEKRSLLNELGITYRFFLQNDEFSPKKTIKKLSSDATLIVTDDFPCFIIPKHNINLAQQTKLPFYTVDSNGVIPISYFNKEEYAAYTIRPKIRRVLDQYLLPFQTPELKTKQSEMEVDCPNTTFADSDIDRLLKKCDIDHSVTRSSFFHGGTKAGQARLEHFISNILSNYEKTRNKPEIDGTSRLSAYLHFGYLSALEIALAVKQADAPDESKEVFLEELIVRRELSFNFAKFNSNFDSLQGLPDWVLKTMREHGSDKRPYSYTLKQLENAETHDELWNAAQREMIKTGSMHNYVRMLWGKNVIAWTPSYEIAYEYLVHLNNKYCLDGRDPNSYAGIAWCFGKHDRPWMERQVFGKIRYLTSQSTGRKFNSKRYIAWTKTL